MEERGITVQELLEVIQGLPAELLQKEVRIINRFETAKAGNTGLIATDVLSEIIVLDQDTDPVLVLGGSE